MTQPTHGLDPNALEAAVLPCDIHLPPATTLCKGVSLAALLTGLRARGMVLPDLAALSQNPGTSNTSGEALRAHLREHWLASIVCDHEAKTDTAICSCSQWADTPHPSVGAAVDAWIEHVFATLPAALASSERSGREAVIEECARVADAQEAEDESHYLSAGRDDDARSHYLWAKQTAYKIAAAIRKLSEVSHE